MFGYFVQANTQIANVINLADYALYSLAINYSDIKRWCVLKQKKILFSDECCFLDFATVDGLCYPTFAHFLNSLPNCIRTVNITK